MGIWRPPSHGWKEDLFVALLFFYIYGTEKESAAFRPLQSRRVRSAQTLQSEREGKRRESMHLSWPTLMSTLSTQKREAYMWKAPSFEGENWKDHLILLSLSLLFFPLRFFVQHSVRTESNFQSGLSLSAESRKRKSRPAAATGRMSTCGSASMPCQVT